MSKNFNIGIIGAGSWGTALSCLLARAVGDEIKLYSNEEKLVNEINIDHVNSFYLGNIKLPQNIIAVDEIEKLSECNLLVIATPSFAFKNIVTQISQKLGFQDRFILIASKGLNDEPLELFSDYIKKFTQKFGFISGPNFAKEVAENKFTSITITSVESNLSKAIADIISSGKVNVTMSTDIITIQIAAIMKNIIAIYAGILKAQAGGENAMAWLVSQGLKEISIISQKLGGDQASLTLPAVIGDLVLTSYSSTSRNSKFGYEFANSNFSKNFLSSYPDLVEGANSARLMAKFIDYNPELIVLNKVITYLS